MKFTKMHGCGNDYVYVNGFSEHVTDKVAAAIKVSDRHFGIGSDGIIFINPSDKADFEMEMYNADGSRAEMCGNGIRSVSKYVYDFGLTDKRVIDIETLAGIKTIELNIDEATNKVKTARVNMGSPVLEPSLIPCDVNQFIGYNQGAVVNLPLTVHDTTYGVTCVSMGNPHAIVFIDAPVRDFPLEQMGPMFEVNSAFPKRVNTEFVRVLDRSTVEMRVWERGSGETLACGTGACATAVACILQNLTEKEVTVKLLGGDLKITWSGNPSDPVFMEGPAATVFTGEIDI